MKTYAAYYDNPIRDESSSGGIFSLLASGFDVVYGVAMEEDEYGSSTIRTEGDISSLRGSKYFQANVGDAFIMAKQDVLAGKSVLFSGTGCQINGLSAFLGQDYDNLLLVDIICHGVPSPKLWREYAKYREKEHGKLTSVNFRCKEKQENGQKQYYSIKDNDPFMRMFLRDYCLRPSCYECRAKTNREADITIGDFWGIETAAPEMSDEKGTSLIITRSDKGQKYFDEISGRIKSKEVSYKVAVAHNPSEFKSSERPLQRNVFFADLDSLSFDEMIKKYASDIAISALRKLIIKAKIIAKRILFPQQKKDDKPGNDYGILMKFETK